VFFNICAEKKREATLISVLTAIVTASFLIGMLITEINPPIQCVAVSFAIYYMLNYIIMGIRRCYHVKRFRYDVILKSAVLGLIMSVVVFNIITFENPLHEMDFAFTIIQVFILLSSAQSLVNILR